VCNILFCLMNDHYDIGRLLFATLNACHGFASPRRACGGCMSPLVCEGLASAWRCESRSSVCILHNLDSAFVTIGSCGRQPHLSILLSDPVLVNSYRRNHGHVCMYFCLPNPVDLLLLYIDNNVLLRSDCIGGGGSVMADTGNLVQSLGLMCRSFRHGFGQVTDN
jgi:hypothetical protein